jgi:hypothetical protein
MDLQMISGKLFFHLLSENKLNNEQFGIFIDTLDTSTQKLVLLHAGGGTGKTFVTCKIFEELALRNEICNCTYPNGVGASHLPQGQTFHSVFRTWTPSLRAGTSGIPLCKKKQCFVKKHSITLTNHTQELLPVHPVANVF